jgi:hypothetical protein
MTSGNRHVLQVQGDFSTDLGVHDHVVLRAVNETHEELLRRHFVDGDVESLIVDDLRCLMGVEPQARQQRATDLIRHRRRRLCARGPLAQGLPHIVEGLALRRRALARRQRDDNPGKQPALSASRQIWF